MGNSHVKTQPKCTKEEKSIDIPIFVRGDNIESKRFTISYLYTADSLLNDLLVHIKREICVVYTDIHYRSLKIAGIDRNSFINPYDDEIASWSTNYRTLQRKPIIDYDKHNITNLGLKIHIKRQKIILERNGDQITCPHLSKIINDEKHNDIDEPKSFNSRSIDPYKCPIYSAMMNENEYSFRNLNHLNEYTHFTDPYVQKPECNHGFECEIYKRINDRDVSDDASLMIEQEAQHRRNNNDNMESKQRVNVDHDISHLRQPNLNIRKRYSAREVADFDMRSPTLLRDYCHMKLHRHTPVAQNIKLPSDVNTFSSGSNWTQIVPLYEPNEDDKRTYKYNDKDGYINALIEELISNDYQRDLCLDRGSLEEDYKHQEFSILRTVDGKLDCDRHKEMGNPLRRDHMLAIILYTGSDCNYDLCKTQRNGDYSKWKWFDYCLHHAIVALNDQETGLHTIYSGLCQVKLDRKTIDARYFNTYPSTSWRRDIALQFVGEDGGMIMHIDSDFRKNAICCDVSWISKFVQEMEILMARSVSRNNAFQCTVLDEDNGIQTVQLTHSLAQINQYHIQVSKSYKKLKKEMNDDDSQKSQKSQKLHKSSFQGNQVTDTETQILLKDIKVKIQCLGEEDIKYDSTIMMKIKYCKYYRIKRLIDDAIQQLQSKFDPVKFTLTSIDNIFGDNCKENELQKVLAKPITNYKYESLNAIYLIVSVSIYHHRVGAFDTITCPAMLKENTDDPTYCVIYAKMKYQFDFSNNHLHHMQNFNHFVADFEGKPNCRYGDDCRAYNRLQKGGDRMDDECHMIIYVHPPRHRNIPTEKEMHIFEVNRDKHQNQPLYKPTFDDEMKYEYNAKNGYLNALIDEIIVNGQQRELGNKENGSYHLLKAVDYKLSLERHKQIGSPLNRSEMLAIICYTGTECYSEMTKCQRNGDFITWKWFDYCLYSAIKKLGIREWGSYTLYSGMNACKLNRKTIGNTFFKTYVSSSWMKFIAVSFASGEKNTSGDKKNKGMILQIDPEYRESFGSICCDVSWISKFKDEFEVLIARGIDNTNNNFDMKVIQENNGMQNVLLTKVVVED